MAASETPRDRKNRLARESYARRKSLLTAEQLEHRHARQRETYRLRTEADSSEQADYRPYMHRTQQKRASNAACMQMYDTATIGRHELGPMDVELPVVRMEKYQLPIINQPPEPLLSLLTGEDSRSCNFRKDIHLLILEQLQSMLHNVNPYVYIFQQIAYSLHENSFQTLNFVIIKAHNERQYVPLSASEIAVLMVGDCQEIELLNRDILLYKQNGGLQKFLKPIVLIFHYIISGCLLQQYIVDTYACIEQNHLNYLKHNQKKIHAELYSGLQDVLSIYDELPQFGSQVGHKVILSSSFVGSPQDAIIIVRQIGKPDLFITMTCNPN
ncbi:21659_t:CDS:2 [Dentiscutata erythropus]|uniref:21659_t:CDS:1 n=1 Tax=Dentiscutata erythropus TaxID=1348616 RepID=A0A9N8ZML9_9GLOM|nr:21659_t:CDS:2 [Dentiscutata erythropus]